MIVCMSGVPLLSGRRKRPDRSASASDPRSQYCFPPRTCLYSITQDGLIRDSRGRHGKHVHTTGQRFAFSPAGRGLEFA